MAGKSFVIRGAAVGLFALALSGCVSVPDAIQGSSPTPQQDLVRVMAALSGFVCSAGVARML